MYDKCSLKSKLLQILLMTIPARASDAKYFTSTSVSVINLSSTGLIALWVACASIRGVNFCNDLATLKRTFATLSFAIEMTVGKSTLPVTSGPQASDRTFIRRAISQLGFLKFNCNGYVDAE